MDSAVDSSPTPDEDALYRHTKREKWGVAVFLWERDGKRAFRFADGEVRVFKKGFYELMVPAPAPADGSADELRAKVRAANAGKKAEIIPTIGDQLVLMLKEYPGGFIGEAWRDKHRGGGRRLKRHRQPAIDQAKELLAVDKLQALFDAQDHEGTLDVFVELLSATDLVPSSHVNKLKQSKPKPELTRTLLEVARNPKKATVRQMQAAIVACQGPATSWQVLTAPLTLLAPNTHICVHPSVFATQGKIALPRFTPPKRASEAGYQRYVDVCRIVTEELGALGHPPIDQLDLHDFIWTTLRPASREELERIHIQRSK